MFDWRCLSCFEGDGGFTWRLSARWLGLSNVFALLPRVGLANRLLVWARATVCAHRLGSPLAVHGWGHLHLGPVLRRESSYRLYIMQVRTCRAPGQLTYARFKSLIYGRAFHYNCPLDQATERAERGECTFIYDAVPDHNDYFVGLRGNEGLLRSAFHELVRPRVRREVYARPAPEIALHVRRGDFVTIDRQLSRIEYFVDAVERIRDVVGQCVPATVFTDGSADEVDALRRLPNLQLHDRIGDVGDLLHMSRANYIVTSLHSTFGYWAAFISDASIILDCAHGETRIRSSSNQLFEGPLESLGRDI